MTALRERLEEIEVMRDLFPMCFYCDAPITDTPLRELVAVSGRNRLAHQVCPSTIHHEAAD